MRVIRETKCIYLIWNEEVQRSKIGIANNPKERMKSLINSSGCFLELIYNTEQIQNPRQFEFKLHSEFEKHKHVGEWFNVHFSKVLKYIKEFENDFETCEIISMYKSGLNATHIAEKIGVSRTAIVKNLISKGINIKRVKTKVTDIVDSNPIIERKRKRTEKIEPKQEIVFSTKLNIAEMVRRNNEKLVIKRAQNKIK